MSALLAAPLCLAGCPGDDTGEEGEEGANDSTTTTEEPETTTTGEPGTSTGAVDSSSGEPPLACEDPSTPETIPAAPVDCTGVDGVLMGSVIIDDSKNSDDPSMLDGIRRVEGSIQLNRTDLTNLDFMACVEEVGGEVTIFGNEQLTNVDGLWSLRELGTNFVFSQNDAITDFNGAPNLSKVIGNLIMKENDALESITGFHSLIGLDGMGVDPETGNTIGGNLTIQQNPVLTTMNGLIGLLVVNGTFAVTNNPELCIEASIACVGDAIVQPAEPPASWTIVGNNEDC